MSSGWCAVVGGDCRFASQSPRHPAPQPTSTLWVLTPSQSCQALGERFHSRVDAGFVSSAVLLFLSIAAIQMLTTSLPARLGLGSLILCASLAAAGRDGPVVTVLAGVMTPQNQAMGDAAVVEVEEAQVDAPRAAPQTC